MLNNQKAEWSSPPNVHAFTTTIVGGISHPPYASFNLAQHVGDNAEHVQRNRQILIETLNLPSEPEWLEQTHSNQCIVVENSSLRQVDAAVTREPNTVLSILTADCLPIVLTNLKGNEVAAIHAGWRGLANGIIDETLSQMHSSPSELMAWIGPAICHQCYETGEEVKSTFLKQYPYTSSAFYNTNQQLHCNLSQLASMVLTHHGIPSIYQSNQCTAEATFEETEQHKYFSYRRGKQTGRIATLIWFNSAGT